MRNSRRVIRIAALSAVLIGAVALVLVLFGGDDSYTYKARFINASQLVNGDQVEIGGTAVGTITDINLTSGGQADISFSLERKYGPLRANTRALVRQNSLSGVANRYIDLQPGAGTGAKLADNATIDTAHTTSAVDLDQVFNVFGPKQRKALSQLIQGFANSYAGQEKPANAGFIYLNPAIASSARLFEAVNRDPLLLKRFIAANGRLVTDVAARQNDLAGLVSNLATTTSAIGRRHTELASAVQQLPDFMRRANTTFVNLRATLDDLRPLVNESKPVAKKLQPFVRQLLPLALNARPTIHQLAQLVRKRGANNDLIDLTNGTVPVRNIAVGPVNVDGKQRPGALPESTQALQTATPELAFARPYATDLTGWFSDFSTPGIYDALGAASNAAPYLNVFSNVKGILGPPIPPDQRAQVFNAVATLGQNDRCPGTAERKPSFTPPAGYECDPTQLPPGP